MPWLGFFLLIGTAALLIGLGKSGRRLVTPFAPRGGISLQLAHVPPFALAVIRSWDQGGLIRLARGQIYADFVLIAFYASFFVFWCAYLAATLPPGSGLAWQYVAMAGEAAAVLAALFDIGENVGMLRLIRSYRGGLSLSGGLTKLVFVSASSKFTLFAASVLVVVVLIVEVLLARVLS